MNNKILVTGGCGFIGQNLVNELLDQNYDVVIIDNLSTGKTINPKAKFYLADIRAPIIEKIFTIEKPHIIFHLAAQVSVPHSVKNPFNDLDINLKGLLNILENAVRVNTKRIIFSSSGGAIYGNASEYPTTEEYISRPISPYAITKLTSEKYLDYYNTQFGLEYVILRYANVYGPGQKYSYESGVVSIFIENILRNKTSIIYRYPDQSKGMIRDYVYVKDVINANIKALHSKHTNEIFNIATEQETSTLELFQTIKKIAGKDADFEFASPRPGDIANSCLSIKKAKNELNWQPQYTLENGLSETIKYFDTLNK